MSSPYGGTDPNSSYPGAPSNGSSYPGSPADGGGSYPGSPAGGSPAPEFGASAPQGGYGSGGATPPPVKKSNTGRNIIIGCVIAALALLLLGGCGALGLWALGRGGDDKPSTSETASQSQSSSEESSASDSTTDPSSGTGDSSDSPTTTNVGLETGETGEVPTVETTSGTEKPTNGAFVYVDVTITNTTDKEIPFSPDNFTLVDESGNELPVAVGTSDASSTSLAPGASATARLYGDVAPGTKLSSVKYDA